MRQIEAYTKITDGKEVRVMNKLFVKIEFDQDEMLNEAQEIKEAADELLRKVNRFGLKMKAMEDAPSTDIKGA